MRIGILVPALRNRGPVLVARDLAGGLVARGHDVVVFYLDRSHEVRFECAVRKLNRESWREFVSMDLIHAHTLRPDLICWVLHTLFPRLAVVTTIHNYVTEDLSLAYGRLVTELVTPIWRRAWGAMHRCVVLSKDAQLYYSRRAWELRLNVVYNGRSPHVDGEIPRSDLSQISALKARWTVIGTVAQIIPRKGIGQLVEALASLPEFAVLIVGDGPALDAVQAQARLFGVSERVLALGYRENARHYYRFFDIYAMPSFSEGMPLAMLEAAAANVPIVCSDIPVFRELFTAQEAAFFTLLQIDSLCLAIRRAVIRAESQAAAAKRRFDSEYSVDAMVEGYLLVYRDVLSGLRSDVVPTGGH